MTKKVSCYSVKVIIREEQKFNSKVNGDALEYTL